MSCALILSIYIHFEDKKINNILNAGQFQDNLKDDIKIRYNALNTSDCEDKKIKNNEAHCVNVIVRSN